MRFADRVALVTGASRGIGKALALRLAAEGCDVVVAAKTTAPDPKLPGTIHETAREIEALGRRALAAELDVRDDAAVERIVAQALARWGRIDFLVNNAAALYWHPVVDTEMKRFDLVMGVNVRGTFACTRHVLPSMIARKFGHILMLSPPVDPHAGTGKVAYAISKFGMTMIAQGVADEVRGHNVAANALWPATLIESQATIRFGIGQTSAVAQARHRRRRDGRHFRQGAARFHRSGTHRRGLSARRRDDRLRPLPVRSRPRTSARRLRLQASGRLIRPIIGN